MLAETQTCEGLMSRIPESDNLHYPLFDLDNCTKYEAKIGLGIIQKKHNLPDIILLSDKNLSIRALCFAQVKFTDYLKMQLELLDMGLLDYNFFWWTVKQSSATIRYGNKVNRPQQQIVDVLYSYHVPIPAKVRIATYDTGVQKRGLTVFLGEDGKIVSGDSKIG